MATINMSDKINFQDSSNYFPCRLKQHNIYICSPEKGTVVIDKFLFHDAVTKLGGKDYFTVAELQRIQQQNPQMYQFISMLVQQGVAQTVQGNFVKAGVRGELGIISLQELLRDYKFTATGVNVTLEGLCKTIGVSTPDEMLYHMDWISVTHKALPNQAKTVACFVPKKTKGIIQARFANYSNGSFFQYQYSLNAGRNHGNGDVIVCEDLGNGSPNFATRTVVNGEVFGEMYDNNYGHKWSMLVDVSMKTPITMAGLPKLVAGSAKSDSSADYIAKHTEEFLRSLLCSEKIMTSPEVLEKSLPLRTLKFNYILQLISEKLKFPCSTVTIKRIQDTSRVLNWYKTEGLSSFNNFTYGRFEDFDGHNLSADDNLLKRYFTVFAVTIADYHLYALTLPTSLGTIKLAFVSEPEVTKSNGKIMHETGNDFCLFIAFNPLFAYNKEYKPLYIDLTPSDGSIDERIKAYTGIQDYLSCFDGEKGSLAHLRSWFGSVVNRHYVQATIPYVKGKSFGKSVLDKAVENARNMLIGINSNSPLSYVTQDESFRKMIFRNVQTVEVSTCPEHIRKALYNCGYGSDYNVDIFSRNLKDLKESSDKYVLKQCISFEIEAKTNGTVYVPVKNSKHPIQKFYLLVAYLASDDIYREDENQMSRFNIKTDMANVVYILGCSDHDIKPMICGDNVCVVNHGFSRMYNCDFLSKGVQILIEGDGLTDNSVDLTVLKKEALVKLVGGSPNPNEQSLIDMFASTRTDCNLLFILLRFFIASMDGAMDIVDVMRTYNSVLNYTNKILVMAGVVVGAYYSELCTLNNTKTSLRTLRDKYKEGINSLYNLTTVRTDIGGKSNISKMCKTNIWYIYFTLSYLTYWINNVDEFTIEQGRNFLTQLNTQAEYLRDTGALALDSSNYWVPVIAVDKGGVASIKTPSLGFACIGNFQFTPMIKDYFNGDTEGISSGYAQNFKLTYYTRADHKRMERSGIIPMDEMQEVFDFCTTKKEFDMHTNSDMYKSFGLLYKSLSNLTADTRFKSTYLGVFFKERFIDVFRKIGFECKESEFKANDTSKFRLKLTNVDNDKQLVLFFGVDYEQGSGTLSVKGQSDNNQLNHTFDLESVSRFLREGLHEKQLHKYSQGIELLDNFILDVVYYCVTDLQLDLLQIYKSCLDSRYWFMNGAFRLRFSKESANHYIMTASPKDMCGYCSATLSMKLTYPQNKASFKALFYEVVSADDGRRVNSDNINYSIDVGLEVFGLPFYSVTNNLLQHDKVRGNKTTLRVYSFKALTNLLYDFFHAFDKANKPEAVEFAMNTESYSTAISRSQSMTVNANSMLVKKRLSDKDFADFASIIQDIKYDSEYDVSKSRLGRRFENSSSLYLMPKNQ